MQSLNIEAIDWDGLATRLRSAMAAQRLSQRRFADAAGVSVQATTKWLGGGRISPERWLVVANVLGLTVPELLGLPDDPDALSAQSEPAVELLRRLAALSNEPFDRAVPDLMLVLQDAQRLAQAHEKVS